MFGTVIARHDAHSERADTQSWNRPNSGPPAQNPLEVRFTELHRLVTELPTFVDDPKASNEPKLEAIQMAWYEEWKDRNE